MKKRFVVCYSDNIPKEKEMHFIQFIKDNKLGWWHWISNMWLLVDSSGQMTASILRDKICKLYSENRVMVIELDGDRDTWAGFGPTQPKNMFDWIKQKSLSNSIIISFRSFVQSYLFCKYSQIIEHFIYTQGLQSGFPPSLSI